MNKLSTYLGDGVYASYDGFQIWLAVNDRDNNVVALEPMTFGALVRYVESLRTATSRGQLVEKTDD
jgi:hypothetical protein